MPEGHDTQPMRQAPGRRRASLPVRVRAAGRTHAGYVRPSNEDHFLVAELDRSLHAREANVDVGDPASPQGWLLVVADGMGGMGSGDVASRVAVRTVATHATALLPWLLRCHTAGGASEAEVEAELERALAAAQEHILRASRDDPRISPRLGTTLTLAYVIGACAFIAHAGDSRCYLVRDGALFCLTRDHTMAQALADAGGEPASDLHHVLVNCLAGGNPELEVDVKRLDLDAGDRLLLCTDGLTGMVEEPRVAALCLSHDEPDAACEALVSAALDAGGKDNVTVIVADVA